MARELSRGKMSATLAGRYIAVVDERGVVVFTVLLRALILVVVLGAGVLEVFC